MCGARIHSSPRWRITAFPSDFVHILEAEGVIVRRPDTLDNSEPYSTPDFTSPSGTGQYNPRDVMTVIGQEIIESNMSWRARFFEYRPYRRLVMDYFKRGAQWTASPKAMHTDDLYHPDHKRGPDWEPVTTEVEPVWDAADVTRCGRDLFFQRSHTSNPSPSSGSGVTSATSIACTRSSSTTTARFTSTRPSCRSVRASSSSTRTARWEMLTCPRTTYPRDSKSFRSFEWLLMNMLSLDHERIIVEKQEEPLQQALREWGFKPIPVAYRNAYKHGGSFHCSTADIRRRSKLESYF